MKQTTRIRPGLSYTKASILKVQILTAILVPAVLIILQLAFLSPEERESLINNNFTFIVVAFLGVMLLIFLSALFQVNSAHRVEWRDGKIYLQSLRNEWTIAPQDVAALHLLRGGDDGIDCGLVELKSGQRIRTVSLNKSQYAALRVFFHHVAGLNPEIQQNFAE